MSLRFSSCSAHCWVVYAPHVLLQSPSFCLHVKNGGMFSWITFVYALWTQSFPNLNPNPLSDCHQARVVKMSKVCTDTEWCLLFEWQNTKVKRFGTAWIFTSYWSLCVSVVTFMVPRNWSLSEIQVEIMHDGMKRLSLPPLCRAQSAIWCERHTFLLHLSQLPKSSPLTLSQGLVTHSQCVFPMPFPFFPVCLLLLKSWALGYVCSCIWLHGPLVCESPSSYMWLEESGVWG